jgi:transposase
MVDIETFLYIPGIKFTNLEIIDKKATFKAQATYKKARCPICGKSSHSVHSSYVRNLKDLPISEYSVSIQLKVRKFFCTNKHCKRKIFSEQPSSDIMKYSRMTSRSKDRVLNILKETSARKGSLISKAILTPVSPQTAPVSAPK